MQAIELLFTRLEVQHMATNEVVVRKIKPATRASGISFVQVGS